MQRKFYHPFTLFKLYRREERPAAPDSSSQRLVDAQHALTVRLASLILATKYFGGQHVLSNAHWTPSRIKRLLINSHLILVTPDPGHT